MLMELPPAERRAAALMGLASLDPIETVAGIAAVAAKLNPEHRARLRATLAWVEQRLAAGDLEQQLADRRAKQGEHPRNAR